MKVKMLRTCVGADYNTVFEYYKNDGIEGVELLEGKTLGYIHDLIQAVGIEDKRYFNIINESDE